MRNLRAASWTKMMLIASMLMANNCASNTTCEKNIQKIHGLEQALAGIMVALKTAEKEIIALKLVNLINSMPNDMKLLGQLHGVKQEVHKTPQSAKKEAIRKIMASMEEANRVQESAEESKAFVKKVKAIAISYRSSEHTVIKAYGDLVLQLLYATVAEQKAKLVKAQQA